jgi:hypothetical protein
LAQVAGLDYTLCVGSRTNSASSISTHMMILFLYILDWNCERAAVYLPIDLEPASPKHPSISRHFYSLPCSPHHHIITSSHHKTSHSTKHLSIQHSNLQSNPIYTLNTTALCTFPLAKTDHFVPRSLVAYMGPLLMYLERLVRLFPLLLLARPRPPLALVLELPLAAPPVAFWPAF